MYNVCACVYVCMCCVVIRSNGRSLSADEEVEEEICPSVTSEDEFLMEVRERERENEV